MRLIIPSFMGLHQNRVDDIDLNIHPPPDLVVEIDITHPSLDKLGLYAAARVPEVWRHDGERMKFYTLAGDSYQLATNSRAFPHVTGQTVERYLSVGRIDGSTSMLRLVKAELPRPA
ncbi:MAG: Uma2 family endonuclease [Acidobacteriota bacterium]|nr:Uma2 family endonuclease [Acidobacteriota bacterium]